MEIQMALVIAGETCSDFLSVETDGTMRALFIEAREHIGKAMECIHKVERGAETDG